MNQIIIENPIINLRYGEPIREYCEQKGVAVPKRRALFLSK
jgi:hypothetical protein